MKTITLAVLLFAFATPAFAQQAPSPAEQHLGQTIGALFVENARLASELEKAQQAIRDMQAKAKEPKLEDQK